MSDIPIFTLLAPLILALLIFIMWKSSALVNKLLLLLLPLAILGTWFISDGAFVDHHSLESLVASLFIALFLLCYLIGISIHCLYLSYKQRDTKQDKPFIIASGTLLLIAAAYFLINLN